MESLDKSIGMYLNYINRKILRFLSLNLKKYNITTEQWSTLLNLLEKDGVNQKELAKKVDKDQATLVRILDILEKKKLVVRKKSSKDRRSFLIYVTPEGKNLEKEVYPFIESLFKTIINGISKDQINLFIDTLNKFEKNIYAEEQKINQNND
ncbi:DNA-binding MarR family transcriptional regulator [Clostridium algifaecis]|uniref:DNA-binding MarR family transcriptional regulator n=1 Tax=Clostridium algifaecis TaxID=1472040 RepID=A0ABS4KV59_9CLOT|nr:MarR family transcriptional regulator [Clostridium algifaecis]MBP2033276.1 DNA-binding MarR family transcriptional regulator [Clostridium algifaecis]